jgi:hypothetical protein
VAQLSQQLLHAVVELQGGNTSFELYTAILGRWLARKQGLRRTGFRHGNSLAEANSGAYSRAGPAPGWNLRSASRIC